MKTTARLPPGRLLGFNWPAMEPTDGPPPPDAGVPVSAPPFDDATPTPERSFALFRNLKHKTIYRVVLGYAVGAWLVLQVAAIVLPGLGIPGWVMRPIIVALLAGFGVALLAGWMLDRRAGGKTLLPAHTGRRVGFIAAALLPAVVTAAFFLVHYRPAAPPVARSEPARVAPMSAQDKSVAVLPFENLSTDKDNAFFADGVQDEVLTDLSKVADLKVISRTSVMQFKDTGSRNLPEIGKALGVAFVVEGSVQRAGNKIRVVAQLIDARTDAHKWAEHYDRDLADVFAIQSEIAAAIAGQLQAAISPQEHAAMMEIPTRDDQAYQFYLRANALWESSQVNDFGTAKTVAPEALDLLKQATARDPGFVRAFVLATDIGCYQYFNQVGTPETADTARRYAETVARLRPGSTDANVVMGEYDYYVRQDFPRAAEEFAEVVRQSPNDARAFFFLGSVERRQGRWEDALGHLRRAMELDPERNRYLSIYLEVLHALRRYPEEEAGIDRRLAAHPQQLEWHFNKAYIFMSSKADTRAARAELALLPPDYDPGGSVTQAKVECDEMDRDYPAATRDLAACPLTEISGLPRGINEGDIARFRGDARAAAAAYAAARAVLATVVREQGKNYNSLMVLAQVDAALGDKATALDEGRRALATLPAGDLTASATLADEWAFVLTSAGEREEAIRTLQAVCGKPYGPDYGWLHADPEWDPLRGDPRFQAMVASLAPKP